MSRVACDHGHVRRLSSSGDQRIVHGYCSRRRVGGEDPSRRQVERQDAAGEGWKYPVLQPPAQDAALSGIGTFFGHDAALDLSDREGRDEKLVDHDATRPLLYLGMASPDAQGRNHIGVQYVVQGPLTLIRPAATNTGLQVRCATSDAQSLRLKVDADAFNGGQQIDDGCWFAIKGERENRPHLSFD